MVVCAAARPLPAAVLRADPRAAQALLETRLALMRHLVRVRVRLGLGLGSGSGLGIRLGLGLSLGLADPYPYPYP